MHFNSYVFVFVFLPCVLAGFALLGRLAWRRAGILWLILCSLFFYAWWNWRYLCLVLGLLLVNYLIATFWLSVSAPALRRLGLIVGLTINLLTFVFFKYAGLLVSSVDSITAAGFPIPHIILPLGISFFIFQKIAYLVDVYHGCGYSKNFLDYCLFVVFFPQLIAGPIVHPRQILPQLSRRPIFGITSRNLGIGFSLFFIGLAKKVLLADTLAPIAAKVFSAAAAGSAPALSASWLGVLAYTLQIYFDFSGYTDMAIGLARMFSIRLPLNFNSPYQAHNIIDFWRRWHMTLSRFLRDYLYIPLGGNRKGPLRRYLNLMLTMLLGGLWHGANWTFVAWGGLHGLYLMINHAWLSLRSPVRASHSARWPHALTFLSVAIAWVFFRADSFTTAGRILAALVGCHGIDWPQFWALRSKWALVLCLLAFVFYAPNTQRVMSLARPALGVLPPPKFQQRGRLLWRPQATWAAAIAVLAVVAILCISKASDFIYYQF